jgi:hypothetical protein
MGKMLVFILGAIAIGYGAYYYLGKTADVAAAEAQKESPMPSAPKRQLDNVRQAAKRIEVQGQQQADKAAAEPRE